MMDLWSEMQNFQELFLSILFPPETCCLDKTLVSYLQIEKDFN